MNSTTQNSNMTSIIPPHISTEIILLAQSLYSKLQESNINEQLIIDANGYQFISSNNDIPDVNMPDVQPLVVQGPPTDLTELESRITKGILQAAINGEVKTRPPVYPSAEYSLVLYNDILDMRLYSTTVTLYEIGRVISDLTFGMSRVKISGEAKRLIKKITSHNVQFKAMAAMRIYQYFSEYPETLEYSKLDQYFAPSVIGKLSYKNSDNLADRIHELLQFTAQKF